MDFCVKTELTDNEIIELVENSLKANGFNEKTVNDIIYGVKRILAQCPKKLLYKALLSENLEREIRPLIDSVFPDMSFNSMGWYAVALRMISEALKKTGIFDDCTEYRKDEQSENTEKSAKIPVEKDALPDDTENDGAFTVKFSPEEAKRLLKAYSSDLYIQKDKSRRQKAVDEAGLLNTDYDAVLKKTGVLLDVRTADIKNIAARIVSCNIDVDLSIGDENAVHILSENLTDKRCKNFYCFAAKYCNMHYPESYPEFDSYTVYALKYFRDNCGFFNFANDELQNYGKYKKFLDMFRKKYGLTEFSVAEISRILYMFGKSLSSV